MLRESFQHFRGISYRREEVLWKAGVTDWKDLKSHADKQLSLFPQRDGTRLVEQIEQSETALQSRNADYFGERLPGREHYRIAHTFSNQTLFLDIETTGLSRFYDEITLVGWSLGRRYSVLIRGDDPEPFRQAAKAAKAIVTFNGAAFDLPFLRSEFPGIRLPRAHVDLRFLSKRLGLKGGQKVLEETLGIRRVEDVRGLQGEEAPLLWHQYCRGNLSALKRLVEYNHADVVGMRAILDECLKRLLKNSSMPIAPTSIVRFAESTPKLVWSSPRTCSPRGIVLAPYRGRIGPRIHLSDLVDPKKSPPLTFVGIDLTGSEDRPSGWCLLRGNMTTTRRLKSDEDLVQRTLEANPKTVSIDSPLSLPEGRKSVFDDDPGRERYGIMRVAERVLKSRGVNVYPALIPSMQRMTKRGIRLAEVFRGHGVPVIESYPGAAQDIMGIPRKRAGVELLATGLSEFGIAGEFLTKDVSHDELDAITSAVVNHFHWSGRYEALGKREENFLIVPDLTVDPSPRRTRTVIGLSGATSAGKTTAGQALGKSLGAAYRRFSQVLETKLRRRGRSPSRGELQKYGEYVHRKYGQRWLCNQMVEDAPSSLVIDGLRFPEDHAFFVEEFGESFLHIHIEASWRTRLERFEARGGSREAFIEACDHPVEANTGVLGQLAMFRILNEGSIEDLHAAVAECVE